jgi:prepilin-type N-terminal cleavage/methylation domain-containing protein
MYFRKGTKGFTLIELLIVVVIIGLLATVAVVAFGDARKRARDTKRIADMRSVVEAMSVMDTYGVTLGGCDGTSQAKATLSSCTPSTYINFAALKDPATSRKACITNDHITGPLFPQNGHDYCIWKGDGTAGATTNDYELGFYLESGAAGLGKGVHYASSTGLY